MNFAVHWPDSIENDITRYVTIFLYLAKPDAGGETFLPLAEKLGNGTESCSSFAIGCEGCERIQGVPMNERANGCYACIGGEADRLLNDCSNPNNPGVMVVPQKGRLVFWYNFHPNGPYAGQWHCQHPFNT